MNYVESKSWTQGWKLVLGLIIFIVILSFMFRRSGPESAEDVTASLAANPHIRETETTLRELYPAEHAQLVAALTETLRQGGNQATVTADASTFVTALLRRRALAIGNAPDPTIRAIAEADLAAARALQRSDIGLCADFLDRGMADDSRPSEAAIALIDHGTALRLRAAHDGEVSRQPPRPGTTRDDNSALLAQLARSDPASAALIREGRFAQARAAQKCTAGIGLNQAALAMPAGQGERILANLYRDALTGS